MTERALFTKGGITVHFVRVKGILNQTGLGMNVYRGCTHGCIYCDSRSVCYRIKHDFEDIEVKENAPELLEKALRGKKQKCMIGTGSMCDPYMPIEEDLRITRQCLEIIDRYGFGAAVQTKSPLVLRDIDLLTSINRKAKAVVQMTLTTYDENLCRIIEPNVATTKERFAALCALKDAGIPTVVWICPILPFINDTKENIEGLLNYCIEAGVKGIVTFEMGLTLREGDREYFFAALDRHFPGLTDKYLRTFGLAYEILSPRNDELMTILRTTCAQHNILIGQECFSYMHEFPTNQEQMSLF